MNKQKKRLKTVSQLLTFGIQWHINNKTQSRTGIDTVKQDRQIC